MTTNSSRQVLPTIYSRTQRIGVKRYSDEELTAFLKDEYNLEQSEAELLARLAAGNITDAVNALSVSKERELYLDLFIELMRKAYMRDVGMLKKWALNVADLGREREMKFLEYCARMVRENFILNIKTPDLNCMHPDEMQFSQKFSPFINERNVLKIFDCLNQARVDISMNSNARLVNFDLAIKTILLLKK